MANADAVPPAPRIRYYLDTEFSEHAPGIELISIALVDERDRTFYAVSSQFDAAAVNPWVARHVLPQIEGEPRSTLTAIREGIEDFVGSDRPEFWAYCPSHDWVLFSWLWGGMGHFPGGFPGIARCLRQLVLDHAVPDGVLPPAPRDEHHALADAEWTKLGHEAVLHHLRNRGIDLTTAP